TGAERAGAGAILAVTLLLLGARLAEWPRGGALEVGKLAVSAVHAIARALAGVTGDALALAPVRLPTADQTIAREAHGLGVGSPTVIADASARASLSQTAVDGDERGICHAHPRVCKCLGP